MTWRPVLQKQKMQNTENQHTPSSNADDVRKFHADLPVIDEHGEPIQMEAATRFESDRPLCYADGRPVREDDLVLHVRFREGRAVGIEPARVWACLYYDDGSPIGVALNAPDAKGSPTIHVFSRRSANGARKLYFRSAVTIEEDEIPTRLLYIDSSKYAGRKVGEIAAELAQTSSLATFALGFWAAAQRDFQTASQYHHRAAAAGYAPAAYELFLEYAERRQPANTPQALAFLQQAAAAGYTAAQVTLADMYAHGRDDYRIPKDRQQAFHWFEQAARKGSEDGQLSLALYWRYGEFEWFPDDRTDVGHDRYGQPEQRKPPYQPNASQIRHAVTVFHDLAHKDWAGNVLAKFQLAECHRTGIGLEQDEAAAMALYAEIAYSGFNGSPEIQVACFYLAQHRFKEADSAEAEGSTEAAATLREEACEILKLAAENGHPPARLLMAQLLMDGAYIAQNHEQAVYHLKRAFRDSRSPMLHRRIGELWLKNPLHPYPETLKILAKPVAYSTEHIKQIRMEDAMFTPVPEVETAYLRLCLEAATRGDHDSMWAAALCYHQGHGTERNLSRALFWYEKAWPYYRDGNDSYMKKLIRKDMKTCAEAQGMPFDTRPPLTETHASRLSSDEKADLILSQARKRSVASTSGRKASGLLMIAAIALLMVLLIWILFR